MTLVVFITYEFFVLPFCYLKLVIHKFALIYYAPTGEKSISRCGRFIQWIIFVIFGVPILGFDCLVDIFWFLKHLYKTDLDKSHLTSQDESVMIHRLTYKKMLKYFEQKNE